MYGFKKFIIERFFGFLQEQGPKDTPITSAIVVLLAILIISCKKQPSTDTAVSTSLMKPKCYIMDPTHLTRGVGDALRLAPSPYSVVFPNRWTAKDYLITQEITKLIRTHETTSLTVAEVIEPSTNASLVEVFSPTEQVVVGTSLDLTESDSGSMDFHLDTKQALLFALVAQYKTLNETIDNDICYLIFRRWQAFFPSVNGYSIDNHNGYRIEVHGGSAAEQDFYNIATDYSVSNTNSSRSEGNDSSDTFLNPSTSNAYSVYNNNIFIDSPEGSSSALGMLNSSTGHSVYNNNLFKYQSDVDSDSEAEDDSDSEADDVSESGEPPVRPRYEGASAIFVPQLIRFFLFEPGEGNAMNQSKLRLCEWKLELDLRRFSRGTLALENGSIERRADGRNYVSKLGDELCLRQFELSIRKAKTRNIQKLIETRPGSEIRSDLNIEQITRAINNLNRLRIAIDRLRQAIYLLLQ